MLEKVLVNYGIDKFQCDISTIGNGLINNTWLLISKNQTYILQRVNNDVFIHPEDIDNNILLVTNYFKKNYPDYFFVSPIKALNGKTMIFVEKEGYFRMFPYVKNSKTILATQSPKQSYEAAKAFGKFTKLLSNISLKEFKIVIPDFHNLSLRFQQFKMAIKNASSTRIDQAQTSIDYLLRQEIIVNEYEHIVQNNLLKYRITHYDTKISNVLFTQNDENLCVIDLDTIMPGYFISDVGDMIRTYVCPVTEEEPNIEKIIFREDYFEEILHGYLEQMKNDLTDTEIGYIVYSGKFMIYMQAIRFLTDYLNNDIYYGAKYEQNNLVRTNNQIALLKKLIEKESQLNQIVINVCKKLNS
ncbi:aminoglycoside phosphotransferase family protein [Rhizosphaericola mali]|uniref:Aminoglycoside phosphotransferase family protein n=2 Tax=Rhizosphaericola mali TaxID=2545455 RepID=A0A5P2GAT1_9BACT|nr:aminoglycoside phosphotransferase family protein [Rhizosphaericola mali]